MVLIAAQLESYLANVLDVSVPLRGLWFLSSKEFSMVIGHVIDSFRPLAGIMVLIGVNRLTNKGSDDYVSVPLRGLWFLSIRCNLFLWAYGDVSVPLRGLWFLSLQGQTIIASKASPVSVPLRGLWFLSQVDGWVILPEMVVSVPLRGLWFLSLLRLGPIRWRWASRRI